VNDDAHSESEIVGRLTRERDIGEWAADTLRLPISRENRIVVELENTNIDPLAGAQVQASA
jgi:hypothetical protein